MRLLYVVVLLFAFEGVLSAKTKPDPPRRSSRLASNRNANSRTNRLASSGVLPVYRSNAGVKKNGGQHGSAIKPPAIQTSPGGTKRVIETYDGNKIPGHTQAKYDAINKTPQLAVNKVGPGGHRDDAIGGKKGPKGTFIDETPRDKLEPTSLPPGQTRQDVTSTKALPSTEGRSEGGISTQTTLNSNKVQAETGNKPDVIVNPINVPNSWADKPGGRPPSSSSSSSSSSKIKRRSLIARGHLPDDAVVVG